MYACSANVNSSICCIWISVGTGAPVIWDGDSTGAPAHNRFWTNRGSQFTPPPAQHLTRFRAEQEAALAAQQEAVASAVAAAANFPSTFDLSQHQLAQALQGLNLFGNFGGGSNTAGGTTGSVHSDRTYSPQQLFQSQEALWSSSSHLNYPSQTSSPFPTASLYTIPPSGKHHNHQQQPPITQASPEFDPEDLARICPG